MYAVDGLAGHMATPPRSVVRDEARQPLRWTVRLRRILLGVSPRRALRHLEINGVQDPGHDAWVVGIR